MAVILDFLSLKRHWVTALFPVFSGSAASEGSSSRGHGQAIPWSLNAHLSTVNQLLPALDLFLKVIHNDLPDMSPPREFCLRLVMQMLEFLHQLLKDGMLRQSRLGGTEREVAEKEDLDRAMEVVMGYISKLRDAMLADELKQKRLVRSVTVRSVTVRSVDSASLGAETRDSVSTDSVDASVLMQSVDSEVSFQCGRWDGTEVLCCVVSGLLMTG